NDTAGHNIFQAGAGDAVEIDSPMVEKILVFDRRDCVFDDLRNFVPGNDDPSLQSEASDHLKVVGIDFRNKAGMTIFQRVHLRQITVIDKQDTRSSAERDGKTKQENENEGAEVPFKLRSHAGPIITGERVCKRFDHFSGVVERRDSLGTDLQYGKKGFLWYIAFAAPFHSAFAFFLFFQQLALAGNVTAIALG